MIQRLRLRYGMFWKGKYPPVLRPLFSVFVLILLLGLAGTVDYYVAKAEEYEKEKPVYESYRQVVLDIASHGDSRFVLANGDIFECKGGSLGRAM